MEQRKTPRSTSAKATPTSARTGALPSGFFDSDGVKIHYEVHGDGPPLILTHGYSSTSGMWQGQVAALDEGAAGLGAVQGRDPPGDGGQAGRESL